LEAVDLTEVYPDLTGPGKKKISDFADRIIKKHSEFIAEHQIQNYMIKLRADSLQAVFRATNTKYFKGKLDYRT
jgi:hypothetical protein